MRDVDPELASVLVYLAEGYGTRLTEARIRVYANALADLPIGQVKAAAARAIRECTYFPVPAELRKMVLPTVEDAGLLAWSALQRAAAEVGAYADLEVEDPLAAGALLGVFGSWAAFCELEDGPQLTLKRQEFLAAYRTARRQELASGLVSRLPGLCAPGAEARTVVGRVTLRGEVTLGDGHRLLTAGAPEGRADPPPAEPEET